VVAGGVLFGLALITKTTVYLPAAAAILAAELANRRRETGPGSRRKARGLTAVGNALAAAAVGTVIGLPWFVRNMRVYGPADPLGLAAHDRAVVGQPRTAEYVAAEGVGTYLERLVVFTFDSFWGVFGWMGVFLDSRIYWLLATVCVAAGVGLVGYLATKRTRGSVGADYLAASLLPLAAAVAAVLLAFVGYNLSFVQHQGRYLFPALIAISVFLVLGVRQWARWLAGLLGLVAPGFASAARRPLEVVAMFGFNAALAGLALASLYRYVVPGLS
jgi:hypothetical protein